MLSTLASFFAASNLKWVILVVAVWRAVSVYKKRQNKITLAEKRRIKSDLDREEEVKHACAAERTDYILQSCPTIFEYAPPYLIATGLLQSLAGERVRPEKHNEAKKDRETIVLKEMKKPKNAHCCPDIVPEGVVSIDWVHPLNNAEDDGVPVVIAVPGLTGDSNAPYIVTLAKALSEGGVRVACYNPRGRGGNELKSPFLYSAGYTEDLRRIVRHVCERYPNAKATIGVGFSLGSNYLAKYVGEEGDNCPLTAAVLAGCPVDCISMSNHFHHSTIGKLMDPVLVHFVQKVRKEYTHVLENYDHIDLEHVASAKTMAEFDHRIIAPMFGFKCVSDYYRYSSCGNVLSNIRRPALFLHAENDPIVPGKYIRMDNFKVNPHLIHCMTEEGGHSMTWPEGIDGKGSWMAKVVQEFVDAISTSGIVKKSNPLNVNDVKNNYSEELKTPVVNKFNKMELEKPNEKRAEIPGTPRKTPNTNMYKKKSMETYMGVAAAASVLFYAMYRRKWR